MKILVCISNYGDKNLNYLRSVLSEYYKMSYEIDIIIDSTIKFDISDFTDKLNIKIILHDELIKGRLVFEHRKTMIANLNKYDLFIYSENDILITETNISTFFKITKNLPKKFITGFLRYEKNTQTSKGYLIDAHPDFPFIRKKKIVINNKRYFQLYNLHSGCFIVINKQLQKAINSKGFSTNFHTKFFHREGYGGLESGATDIYTQCGFKHKILPFSDDLDDLIIHHLPNKYINLDGFIKKERYITLNDLKKELMKRNSILNRIRCFIFIDITFYSNTLYIKLKKMINITKKRKK